jgi:hypothetical protein
MDRPSKASHQKRSERARLADPVDFWQAKGLDELAAEQAVAPVGRLRDVLGAAATLWADDAELDAFLAALAARRRNGA